MTTTPFPNGDMKEIGDILSCFVLKAKPSSYILEMEWKDITC
jgi:hypothetical protein